MTCPTHRTLRLSLCLALMLSLPAAWAAQAGYPTRRIELVAAGSAGGGLDTAARALDRALHEAGLLEQPIIVNNLSGAGGDAAKNYVHLKKGDPHELYLESNRIFLNKIMGTTPLGLEDFTPIARLVTEYLVWAVQAGPPRSAKDILNQVKADPTSVVFATGTMPGNDYFNIVHPALLYGVDYRKMRVVTFRSGGNQMSQLLGGHVPVISTTVSEALEQAKAGKVRLIALSAPTPQGGDLKDVPTWRSMGIAMDILHWRGLFMPPGTAPEVVAFWDDHLARLMKTPQWKKVLVDYGWADAFAGSAQFKRELEAEREVTGKLLHDVGFVK